MEYYENTTRVTNSGYAAIVRMKRRKQRIICRIVSVLLAVPFLQRCVYYLIMRFTTKDISVLNFMDGFFAVLLLLSVWLWTLPNRQCRDYIQRTRNKVDLQAVNQYTFLPEGITMMTTSSLEKYHLPYDALTWVRSNSGWMVLFFEEQNFTMLVDKKGFTKGNSSDCLNFLRDKMDGRR